MVYQTFDSDVRRRRITYIEPSDAPRLAFQRRDMVAGRYRARELTDPRGLRGAKTLVPVCLLLAAEHDTEDQYYDQEHTDDRSEDAAYNRGDVCAGMLCRRSALSSIRRLILRTRTGGVCRRLSGCRSASRRRYRRRALDDNIRQFYAVEGLFRTSRSG